LIGSRAQQTERACTGPPSSPDEPPAATGMTRFAVPGGMTVQVFEFALDLAIFARTAPAGFCCRAGWEESVVAIYTGSGHPEHCPRCHRTDCITDHAMTDAANAQSSRGLTQIIRATWPEE